MFLFLKTAWLNIIKHGKRSVIVFIAVTVSVTIMILVNGVMKGLTSNLVENVLPSSGHISITREESKTAANPLDPKYLLSDADGFLEALDDPRIVHKEKVLSFGALVMENQDPSDTSKEVKNLGLSGVGIRTDSTYYDNIRKGIVKGRFIRDDRDLILSVSIAKLLSLDVGDPVTVLTSDVNGNPWYQEFTLSGLYTVGSDQVDEYYFFVTHRSAEELLDTAGMTREIRLSVKDYDGSAEVRTAIEPVVEARSARAEIWQETWGSFLTLIKFFDVLNVIINAYFSIVAASVIINAIVMSVFERIREYGTLRAIGLKRRSLFAMILTEAALLGFCGSLTGTVIGFSGVSLLHRTGVDVGALTEYFGFGNLFYPVVNPPGILFAASCGMLIALLAGTYAARVCSKLTITESLMHL